MKTTFDIIIRNGTIYDGVGNAPVKADLGIKDQFIQQIGDLSGSSAATEIDAAGLAVAPGFINVMSWAPITSLHDGRSQSDIRQGVTLEVFGEAWSEGPLTEEMKKDYQARQGDIKFDVQWATLGGFLEHLEKRGVSTNIASYVGATTIRIYAIGPNDRSPTPQELDLMRQLVRQSMEEGALGLRSALIYPPGSYAKTEELIELAKVVAEYDGIYISHLRSEGNAFLVGLEELLTIAREANVRSEIYHLKAMGEMNWHKMDAVIKRVEEAQASGLQVSADMYTYTAGGTGLGATMPQWTQDGGNDEWIKRLKNPEMRKKIRVEMTTPSNDWENVYLMAGSPENMILVRFNTDELKPLLGKTLAEISAMRGTDPIDTIMDLVIEDNSNAGVVYFMMSEENISKQIKLPWVCIGSDAPSQAPEGDFLKSSVHPRAYGTFARYLAKYVRDQELIPLEEAIRKITSFPAENLKIERRGRLTPGYYADIAIFDPEKIQDHATFAKPQQYATGMLHVFVNGEQVLKDGEHTGATPGKFVRGPGYKMSA
ncbi:MAG: D-aminoacylase [Anaerolineaceae bacterium]|nr:D-aminoacylase [Anaerolineaceae bacterium]